MQEAILGRAPSGYKDIMGGLNVHGIWKNNDRPPYGFRRVDFVESGTGDIFIFGHFMRSSEQEGIGHKAVVYSHTADTVEAGPILYIGGREFREGAVYTVSRWRLRGAKARSMLKVPSSVCFTLIPGTAARG